MAEMTNRELLLFSMLDLWSKMMRNIARELSPSSPQQVDDLSGLFKAAQTMADELESSAILYAAKFQRDYACEHLVQIRGRMSEAMRLFQKYQEMHSRPAPVIPIN